MDLQMFELDAGFTYESTCYDRESWLDIIGLFDDANIYQTWSYDSVRYGPQSVSHLIIRFNGSVVAAAQARIMKIPLIDSGIGYVRWGPLWKAKGRTRDPEVFRQVIRALKNEFVLRRNLMLRIFPAEFRDVDSDLRSILLDEGYMEQPRKAGERTILLFIGDSLDELRKNFHQKWRNLLNHAERNQLEVFEGESEDYFLSFKELYREMLERKKFEQSNDINEFQAIQKDLPEGWKMRIFLCSSGDKIGAGAICSALGNKGIYLFGATNEIGMANKGSYLIQWRILQWLKSAGCHWYDLNGINPMRNPGTYRFKKGVAGENGRDVFFLGQYDCFSTTMGRMLSSYGDPLFLLLRKCKNLIKRMN